MASWISGFCFGALAMHWLWIFLHPDRERILRNFREFAKRGFRD
jgi:hypothetical protein